MKVVSYESACTHESGSYSMMKLWRCFLLVGISRIARGTVAIAALTALQTQTEHAQDP